MPHDEVDNLARLSAELATPIAAGENECTRYGFRACEHLAARHMLVPVDDGSGPPVRVVGNPVKLSAAGEPPQVQKDRGMPSTCCAR